PDGVEQQQAADRSKDQEQQQPRPLLGIARRHDCPLPGPPDYFSFGAAKYVGRSSARVIFVPAWSRFQFLSVSRLQSTFLETAKSREKGRIRSLPFPAVNTKSTVVPSLLALTEYVNRSVPEPSHLNITRYSLVKSTCLPIVSGVRSKISRTNLSFAFLSC